MTSSPEILLGGLFSAEKRWKDRSVKRMRKRKEVVETGTWLAGVLRREEWEMTSLLRPELLPQAAHLTSTTTTMMLVMVR
jgi:hypothetical protein